MSKNLHTFKNYLKEAVPVVAGGGQNISDIGTTKTNVQAKKEGTQPKKDEKEKDKKEEKETKQTSGSSTAVKVPDVQSKPDVPDVKEETVAANAAGLDAPLGMKKAKKQLSGPTNDYIKKNEREQKSLSILRRKVQNGSNISNT